MNKEWERLCTGVMNKILRTNITSVSYHPYSQQATHTTQISLVHNSQT